jgi:hypothetical protein
MYPETVRQREKFQRRRPNEKSVRVDRDFHLLELVINGPVLAGDEDLSFPAIAS